MRGTHSLIAAYTSLLLLNSCFCSITGDKVHLYGSVLELDPQTIRILWSCANASDCEQISGANVCLIDQRGVQPFNAFFVPMTNVQTNPGKYYRYAKYPLPDGFNQSCERNYNLMLETKTPSLSSDWRTGTTCAETAVTSDCGIRIRIRGSMCKDYSESRCLLDANLPPDVNKFLIREIDSLQPKTTSPDSWIGVATAIGAAAAVAAMLIVAAAAIACLRYSGYLDPRMPKAGREPWPGLLEFVHPDTGEKLLKPAGETVRQA